MSVVFYELLGFFVLSLGGGLLCITLGVRGLHRHQQAAIGVPLKDRTAQFLIAGYIAFSVGIFVLVSISSYARTISWLLLIGSVLVSVIGEFLLYRSLRFEKRNVYAPWVIGFGFLFFFWSFFLILSYTIHVKEPFTFLYICLMSLMLAVVQSLLVGWMKRDRKK